MIRNRGRVLSVVLVLATLAGWDSVPARAQTGPRLGAALAELDRGHVFEAIRALKQIAPGERDFGAASYYLSVLYTEMGLVDKAADYLDRAIELGPSQPVHHYQRGVIRLRQRRWPEALDAFSRALAGGMDRAGAGKGAALWRQVGDTHVELFDRDQALEAYRQALEHDPHDARTRLALGRIHLDRGALEEAAGQFRIAVENEPGLPEAYAHLGRTYLRLEDTARAVETFTRALEVNPNDQESRYGLGLALLAAGRAQDGRKRIAEFQNVKSVVARADRLLKSALKLDASGRVGEAKDRLEEVVRLAPGYARGLQALGRVLLELGDAERAVPVLERAVAANPLDAETYANLASGLLETGRADAAIQAAERAVILDEDEPRYHEQAGEAYRRAQRLPEARAAFERARALTLQPAGDAAARR